MQIKKMKSFFKKATAISMIGIAAGCSEPVPPAIEDLAKNSGSLSTLRISAFTCGPFSGGYCTDWCTLKFNEIVSPSKKDWSGNAGAWFKNARDKGWSTSTDVTKGEGGAIAVWSGGGFGHVGRCVDGYKKREEKNSKGKVIKTWYITIDEYNWGVMKTGASKVETKCYSDSAITVNYGKQTSVQIENSKLTRGSYTFVGYIFPRKAKK